MEKMKGPLWDVIPELLKDGGEFCHLGPIAHQLFTCVRSFHEEKHVLVDIKPENFMLAYSDHNRSNQKQAASTTKKRGGASPSLATANKLALKVRVLDFGCVAPWCGPQGQRLDEGISELVGTPLYASLNVHNLSTPARRDDIESIGYVISEMIIRVVASANGTAKEFEAKKKDAIPSYLPWSAEGSDKAIGEKKEKEVTNLSSTFFKRMGDKATAKIMKDFLDKARSMAFKETPDYEGLEELLLSLEVPLDVPKKKAAKTTKSKSSRSRADADERPNASAAGATARSKRAAARMNAKEESDNDDESPHEQKHQKKNAEYEEFSDATMGDAENDDDAHGNDTDYEDAQETFVEMDWEPINNNDNKSSDKENSGAKSKAGLGVCLEIQDGPHQGEHFVLDSSQKSVILGRKPVPAKSKPADLLWPLSKDDKVADAHVRLTLRVSRNVCSVTCSDLSSTSPPVVKRTKTKPKSDTQLFIGDTFSIGESTFIVRSASAAAKIRNTNVGSKSAPQKSSNNEEAEAESSKGRKMTKAEKAEARKRAREAMLVGQKKKGSK